MTTANLPKPTPDISQTIPKNHLVGVVDGVAALDAIRVGLQARGVRLILLFQPSRPEPAAETSLTDWFVEGLGSILSEENGFRDQYKAAADAGAYVVAVPLDDQAALADFQALLERHGAHTIRNFGSFAVTSL